MYKRYFFPTLIELILNGFNGTNSIKWSPMKTLTIKKSATMSITSTPHPTLIPSKPVSKKKICPSCAKKLDKILDLHITKWLSIPAKLSEGNEPGWCSWKETAMISKVQRKTISIMDQEPEMIQDVETQYQVQICYRDCKSYANSFCRISNESRACYQNRSLQWTDMGDHLYP